MFLETSFNAMPLTVIPGLLGATETGRPARDLRPLTPREQEQIDRLIARNRPLLRKLCNAQMNRKEDAEDLESATVATICRRFSSFDPNRGTFGTWLGTIVRNEASDWRRRASRQPYCVANDETSEAFIERAVAKSYEPSELSAPQLARLPALLRQAFTLVKMDGLTSAEAAVRMGTTDGTVRTYVWKARRILRGACFADRPASTGTFTEKAVTLN